MIPGKERETIDLTMLAALQKERQKPRVEYVAVGLAAGLVVLFFYAGGFFTAWLIWGRGLGGN